MKTLEVILIKSTQETKGESQTLKMLQNKWTPKPNKMLKKILDTKPSGNIEHYEQTKSVIRIVETEESNVTEIIFDNIKKSCPNIQKQPVMKQEAHRTQNRLDQKRNLPLNNNPNIRLKKPRNNIKR